MRNLFGTEVNSRIKTVKGTDSISAAWSAQPVLYFIILFATFLFTACKKYAATEPSNEEQAKSARTNNGNQEFVNSNSALPAQTIAELFQVRAATANYMDTAAAKANGYVNTGIQLPNMGLHFANFGLVGDGKFDLTKPEFLVYNKLPNGNFELVAVEYGVPIDFQHTDIPPAGFTGDADEWDFNTLGLGLWTLHAWVWKTNPDGVFKMMNPIVP
ncbi:MAG TPA: hypothetical protein VGQ04_07570 [Chitinophagaceae bacterium]|jgi:hypothetical protein|nr:hypothetical protein [Chitinophagaceae bacterium]